MCQLQTKEQTGFLLFSLHHLIYAQNLYALLFGQNFDNVVAGFYSFLPFSIEEFSVQNLLHMQIPIANHHQHLTPNPIHMRN